MTTITRPATGLAVLTEGPPRYLPETPWSVIGALAATGLIALAPGALAVAALLLAAPDALHAEGAGPLSLKTLAGVAVALGTQVLSLGLVWFFAGIGGPRGPVLRLTGERFPLALYAAAALILIVTTGLLELLLYTSFKLDFFADTGWLAEGLNSPLALGTVLIGVVFAPLWEELTFRGFLLSALAKSRLRFWGGAMLSNILWTSLHAYSWAGMASVFLAGVILSWLVWRTGSIKPAIVAHMVGNLFALAFTYGFAPVPA